MDKFLTELADLMEKHGISIGFDPRRGDTHGMGDAGICFYNNTGQKLYHYHWDLNPRDIRDGI